MNSDDLLNLAIFREILIIDLNGNTVVPPNVSLQGRAAKEKVILMVEDLIAGHLANIEIPTSPIIPDKVTADALVYLNSPEARDKKWPEVEGNAYEKLKDAYARKNAIYAQYTRFFWLNDAKTEDGNRIWPESLVTAITIDAARFAGCGTAASEIIADPKIAVWIKEAEKLPLSNEERRNLVFMREGLRQNEIYEGFWNDFYAAQNKVGVCWEASKFAHDNDHFDKAERYQAWLDAFAEFLPYIQGNAGLWKIVNNRDDWSDYQAWVDTLSPGLTEDMALEMGEKIQPRLRALRERIEDQQAGESLELPLLDRQDKLATLKRMMSLVMNLENTRFDYGTIAVCGGGDGDVRINCRDKADESLISTLDSLMHEFGHGQMRLHAAQSPWHGQPNGEVIAYFIDEAVAMFWQRYVFATPEFMEKVSDKLREQPGFEGAEWGAENLLRIVRNVRNNFTRVEADEVTNMLLLSIRVSLEQPLINGELAPCDLAQTARDKIKNLFGVDVVDDKYLPQVTDKQLTNGTNFLSYMCGEFSAAAIAHAINAELDLKELISNGRFDLINSWMNERFYSQGSLHNSGDLLKRATGMDVVEAIECWFEMTEKRFISGWAGHIAKEGRNHEILAHAGREFTELAAA